MRAVGLDVRHGLVVNEGAIGVIDRAVANAVERVVSRDLEMKGVWWQRGIKTRLT